MGWFDEQIEYRKKHEQELLADSFDNIAKSITGRKMSGTMREGADEKSAISQLVAYFGLKEKEIPKHLKDFEDRLDYVLSSSGILYREVKLSRGWHADAMGHMIATLSGDNTVIALLPDSYGAYVYTDPHTGSIHRVNADQEKKIGPDALCFYRPFPLRKLKTRDLFRYMLDCLTFRDLFFFCLASLAIVLTGILIPKLNYLLMDSVADYGSKRLLFAVMSFMLFATISNVLLSAIRSLLLSRIRIRMSVNVNAASMMRILSLPAAFFKNYTSGELAQYIDYLNSLCSTLVDSVFSTGLAGIFSLVFLTQIFKYARSLVWPSLIVTLITLAISLLTSSIQARLNRKIMILEAKENGLVYSLISGIQKIRLTGAQKRAFVKWSDLYARSSELTYNPPAIVRMSSVITSTISLIGTAVMFYISVRSGISVADYYAFNSAYAYISAAFTSLASVALAASTIKPSLEIIRPLLEAEPEISEGKETIANISGSIELSHVTFGYDPESKPVFEDLNLKIPAHQYIAIVGRSGCGKSTLIRLMLGFENPSRGAIYFDNKDIRQVDLHSLRRLIGTVMQDGRIFPGSIFDNIVISAPTLKLEDAWQAAEISGIADDIREMPMGMSTILQEAGGISGGQRQRLLIARAIAPKPSILIFDEATSALDNITQKQVTDALDNMKCTRIVIAHRLSTIRHCDRILVIDDGKIAEDGSYEELIARQGIFTDLINRQRPENA